MKTNLKTEDSVQGGDVMGTRKIDISQGKSIEVAAASFQPGYSLETTYEAGYVDEACTIRGYSDYGIGVGEASPIGGKKIG